MNKIMILTASMAALAMSAHGETIQQIKALPKGAAIAGPTTGVVVQLGGGTGRLQFVMCDPATADGILVDNAGTGAYTRPNIGDIVSVGAGVKDIFSNLHEYSTTVTVINVLSTSNSLPAPKVYSSIAQLLAQPYSATGDYVRLNNVNITGTLPANGNNGTTWLNGSATGSANFSLTDGGTSTVVARIASDTAGAAATWQAKPIPSLVSAEKFSVVGTLNAFSSGLQIQLGNPAGTTAKFDSAGPIIAPAVVPPAAGARDWDLFD